MEKASLPDAPSSDGSEKTLLQLMSDFSELLEICGRVTCLRGHDKIYALLGILTRRFGQSLERIVPVDYEQPVELLYTKINTQILGTLQSLDLLPVAFESVQETNPRYPSWVADYRKPKLRQSIAAIRNRANEYSYDAARKLPRESQCFSIVQSKLMCIGVLFDKVEEAIPVVEPFNLLYCIQKVPNRILGRRCLEVLWRTLVQDREGSLWKMSTGTREEKDVASAAVEEHFICHMFKAALESPSAIDRSESCESRITRMGSLLLEFEQSTEALPDYIKDWYLTVVDPNHFDNMINSHANKDAETMSRRLLELQANIARFSHHSVKFTERFQSSARSRCLFRTRRGLLGLGFDTLKSGDQVWILVGASTPIILRPTSDLSEFLYRGDAFILDHMYGEILGDRYGIRENIQNIRIV